MDIGKVSELKEFIESCKSNPSLLHTPSLQFFKSYLLRYYYHSFLQFNSVIPISISSLLLCSLGARIPPQPKTEPVVDDDDIIESDIEFDNTDDVVQPDNDPPHKMGDPSAQVTDDQRDAAQLSKSKAIDAISQGNFDQALDLLTQAILLNPHSSILYATRASVFIKLKKPNAAIRDSDTALKVGSFYFSSLVPFHTTHIFSSQYRIHFFLPDQSRLSQRIQNTRIIKGYVGTLDRSID